MNEEQHLQREVIRLKWGASFFLSSLLGLIALSTFTLIKEGAELATIVILAISLLMLITISRIIAHLLNYKINKATTVFIFGCWIMFISSCYLFYYLLKPYIG